MRSITAGVARVSTECTHGAFSFQRYPLPFVGDAAATPDASRIPDGALAIDAPVVIDAPVSTIDAPISTIDAPTAIDAPLAIDAPSTDGAMTDAPVDGPLASSPCFPDFAGQVACYLFEPNADISVVVDGSQYGNNATASSILYEPGYDNDAIELGVTSRVVANDSQSLDVTDEFTIEAWVNPSSLTMSPIGASIIVSKEGQYGLYITSTGELTCLTSAGQATGGSVLLGTFTHVGCVFSQAGVTVYVGGLPVGTGTVSGAIRAGTNPLVIGGQSPCTHAPCQNPYAGLMDDLTIWNYARSYGQICADAHFPGC